MADFVDTNVFVYAHDRDAGDKHAVAIDLIARLARSGELTTSAQVVNELANVLQRKLGRDRGAVAAAVSTVCAHAIVLPLTGELTAMALGPGMDAGCRSGMRWYGRRPARTGCASFIRRTSRTGASSME